jgi:hypothetical protein
MPSDGREEIDHKSEARDRSPRPCMLQLCTAYPQAAGNGSRSDRESALLGRRGTPFYVSVSQQSAASSAGRYNLDSTPVQCRPSLRRPGIRSGAFMREANTRAMKPKKPQTATMKRRSLKLKSIEVAPTKARSPQVRALVVLPPQPPGM